MRKSPSHGYIQRRLLQEFIVISANLRQSLKCIRSACRAMLPACIHGNCTFLVTFLVNFSGAHDSAFQKLCYSVGAGHNPFGNSSQIETVNCY